MSMAWFSHGQGGSKSKGRTERSGVSSESDRAIITASRHSGDEDPAQRRSKSIANSLQRQGEDSHLYHEATSPLRGVPGSYNSSSGSGYDYLSVHTHEKVHSSDDSSLICEHCGRPEGYPDRGSHRAVFDSHSRSNDST